MTAEVAVMNRQAIALAADSAVTIESEGNRKAWQSANKIFGLSRNSPIGVMVYGAADFMGVPWDSIIKIYRDQLEGQSFATVSDYADDFLRFLSGNRKLFPADAQREEFEAHVGVSFLDIRNRLEEELRGRFAERTTISLNDVEETLTDVVRVTLDHLLAEVPKLSHVSDGDLERLRKRYARVITSVKKAVFQDLPLTSATSRRLTRIAVLLWGRETFSASASGVVIAGYGDEEHFPTMEALRIEAIVNNEANYVRDEPATISSRNGAVVRAFAQSEMVYAFMEGIDTRYQIFMEQIIAGLCHEYPRIILGEVKGISKKRREEVRENLEAISTALLERLGEICEGVRAQHYADPIVQVVTVLPKDELAAMAEALVNLTSFRRKVSLQVETVGGPIDVAVISKGDGFVWIKRKNYFDLEMNPHVLARYSN